MGSKVPNTPCEVIEIEDDVINLDDLEKTPEGVVREWNAKIRRKLAMFSIADNDQVLCDVMKDYLKSLSEIAMNCKSNELLKNKVYCHISFLYSYYCELRSCTADNYLNIMEDILTEYCNLELEVIQTLKKDELAQAEHKRIYDRKIVRTCRRIIYMLTLYLPDRSDHMLHVLIKLRNFTSKSCKDVLNGLYKHFLIKIPPVNLSDESFCRSYILFQRWKEIIKREDWAKMDEMMYAMFKRDATSVRTNRTLSQILMPASDSTVGIVLQIYRTIKDMSNSYFKYITSKESFELENLELNIDLKEDELFEMETDDEDVEVMKVYSELQRNMAMLPAANAPSPLETSRVLCKQEIEEDDDVQFIGVTILPRKPVQDVFVIEDETPEPSSNTMDETPPEATSTPVNALDVSEPETISTSTPCSIPTITPTSTTSSELIEFEDVTSESSSQQQQQQQQQPKVSLVSISTQFSNPPSPSNINPTSATVVIEENHSEECVVQKSIETQTVEVMLDDRNSDKNYLYNDYGLTTPPFEISSDDYGTKPNQACIYSGENSKEIISDSVYVKETRTVEVQVDALPPPSSQINNKNFQYNNYGLTPPFDAPVDDVCPRSTESTCIYPDIVHQDIRKSVETDGSISDSCQTITKESEQFDDVPKGDLMKETVIEEEIITNELCEEEIVDHDSEFNGYDGQLDLGEIVNFDGDEYELEVRDREVIESDKEPERVRSEYQPPPAEEVVISLEKEAKNSLDGFASNDQIDTGQIIPNTAPNIHNDLIINVEDKKGEEATAKETFNGNTVLMKQSPNHKHSANNRTNGRNNHNPSKIIFSTAEKIKTAPLADFSKFENDMQIQQNKRNDNYDFNQILSGPLTTKIVPIKHNNFLTPEENLDIFGCIRAETKTMGGRNSLSNSPTEMASPAYEKIDDFGHYYTDSVNGKLIKQKVITPSGILKKSHSSRKKDVRVRFQVPTNGPEDNTFTYQVLKCELEDPKLWIEPVTLVERLTSDVIKKWVNHSFDNSSMLRIDFNKTIPFNIKTDPVVHYNAPSTFNRSEKTRNISNSGPVMVMNRTHLEKKLEKRKLEAQVRTFEEVPVKRKRASRTPKETKTVSVRRGRRKRQIPVSQVNNFTSNSDSESNNLAATSGAYTNKPFRFDLTS